jgi:5-methylcytosine-specific restriction endonuclease McrA
MERTLKNLSDLERKFINTVIINSKTYTESAESLNVNLKTIRQLYKDLESHWRPLIAIRNKWKSKQIGGDFWDFCYWYLSSEKRCRYCGITETELTKLHLIGIVNKRPSRGKTLEIDRMVSSEQYSNIKNLTYCCYWCNNAKTDTFTEEEFKVIGKAISTVWKKRLTNDN